MDIHFECTQCGKCCHDTMIPLTVDEADQWLERGDPVHLLCEGTPWPAGTADRDPRSLHFRRRSFAATSGKMPIRVVVILVAPARGACPQLLPDMRCGIYDARPLVCRIYPAEVNPWIALQPASKACPPEAWSAGRPLLQRDGVMRDDVMAANIQRSRDGDASDVTVKCRLAEYLGIKEAGMVHEAVLAFSPTGKELLLALRAAKIAHEPPAVPHWKLISNRSPTLDRLIELGFSAHQLPPKGSRDYELLQLSRTAVFGPYI